MQESYVKDVFCMRRTDFLRVRPQVSTAPLEARSLAAGIIVSAEAGKQQNPDEPVTA